MTELFPLPAERARPRRSLYGRLIKHITVPEGQLESTGCWEHDAPLSRPRVGYPRISLREGGRHIKRLAHVLMYQEIYGPVPEGHEVHHWCFNHLCCNPNHLEALPIRDNRAMNVRPS